MSKCGSCKAATHTSGAILKPPDIDEVMYVHEQFRIQSLEDICIAVTFRSIFAAGMASTAVAHYPRQSIGERSNLSRICHRDTARMG